MSSSLPSAPSQYRPAWWVPGPHAQTLWGKLVRRPPQVQTRMERWETFDGDFLDVHHVEPGGNSNGKTSHPRVHLASHPNVSESQNSAPHIVLLHGLEGSIRSHYAQGLLAEIRDRGWGGHLIVFRSCGDELNRTLRFYHSGETTDLAFVLDRLFERYPHANFMLAGVSLGGNVLLKYLGERGDTVSPRIVGAAAVSVPFDLSRGSKHISHGFSKIYERHFLRSLKEKVRAKMQTFPDLADPTCLDSLDTLFGFDDAITSHVHGFVDAEDYYTKSSSIAYLHNVHVNTLLLSAVDDPFLPSDVLNDVRAIASRNSCLHLEFVDKGGHAGFVSGWNPFRPLYYLEHRVCEYFDEQLRIANASLRTSTISTTIPHP